MKPRIHSVTAAAALLVGLSGVAYGQSVSCDNEFPALDTDGNGTISMSEVENATNLEFKRLDGDASGGISRSEWSNCNATAILNSDQAGGQSGARPLSTDEQFQAADVDQNGNISREEAAQAAETSYADAGNGRSEEDYARSFGSRFALLDADGDGSISRDEWSRRDQVQIAAFIERSFGGMDRDNNGELSQSEFQTAQAQNDPARAGTGEPLTVWHYYIIY